MPRTFLIVYGSIFEGPHGTSGVMSRGVHVKVETTLK
jgi:hypothetical protein